MLLFGEKLQKRISPRNWYSRKRKFASELFDIQSKKMEFLKHHSIYFQALDHRTLNWVCVNERKPLFIVHRIYSSNNKKTKQ